MNTQEIIVSIVMPTFNRASMIGRAIESVMNQNYKYWELLIIDNESTDETVNVVKQYSKDDYRVKYHSVKKSPNKGLSDYLNYGIQNSKGTYIARLDDDDEWCDKDKLEKQVTFLENNSDYNLVGGGAIMVNTKGKELYKFFKRETDVEIRNSALYACPFWHSTVLFRKNVINIVGGYNNLRFGEDWEFWLRLGKIGKFYNFKEYFSLYLTSDNSFSVTHQRFVRKTIIGIIKKYRNDYPNYRKALLLNLLQYIYSFFPSIIKNRTHNFLAYIKRNFF